jgi:ADP-ribosylglycohydrolase
MFTMMFNIKSSTNGSKNVANVWRPTQHQLDQIRGCLWGVVLGDVLGHPYEFDHTYDGYSDHIVANTNSNVKLGSVSDDTEMMLSLFKSLFDIRGEVDYDSSSCVFAYTQWANSQPWDIGHNTRTLFGNPLDKYMLYYNAAIKSIRDSPSSQWSQSNGCLMRCAPLIIFDFNDMIWRSDCALSNPHPICLECTDIYFEMLFMLLGKKTRKFLSLEWSNTPCIQEAIQQVLDGEKRDVSKQRGWIVHALYFAMMMYHNQYDTFSDGMQTVIGENLDSDTDTNAAIAGAILGCKLGYRALYNDDVTNKNLRIIRTCDTDRTKKYPSFHPNNIDKYLQSLFGVTTQPNTKHK